MMQVSPNSRNIIPGKVFFTVDFCHPEEAVLNAMDRALREACAKEAAALGLVLDLEEIWYSPPVKFARECVAAVERAAKELGYAHMPIISGAGHDSVYLSHVAPTAMVFVPCENGISHNEIESATKEDVAAGCDVLLRAMIERANAAVA
jgi:N-carbamoyl-L-amino-acid hydrolase